MVFPAKIAASSITFSMELAQKIAINYFRAKLNLIGVVSKRKAAHAAFDLFCTPFRRSPKALPRVFERAEKLSFSLDGITLNGYRFNHPATEKALLIHGFESSAKNFERYVAPLVRKGYEVIAFDGPGHGKSGGKRIHIPLYLKALEEICERYGPIRHFMAHSFGALTLAHLLEQKPFDAQTRAAFIAPATETVTAIDSFFKLLDLNGDIRKEFDHIILEKSGCPPEFFSILRAMKNIRARILWIHDEQDELTPLSDALRVKDGQFPNVTFHITQGLGHRRIYRENKVVRLITEFL